MFSLLVGTAQRAPLPTLRFSGLIGRTGEQPYFIAPKRLSNEFVCTIGCEPATSVSLGAGASAAGALSVTDGLGCGRVAACLVSAGFDAAAFGVAASGRGACSPRLASAFGFAGDGGGVAAVVSAVPPRPILRARLLKKPSDCAVGAADATRVGGAGAGAGADAGADAGAATTGSSEP